MFRKSVWLTPIDYLNHQRMDLARKLLVETELRMDEITVRTGNLDASAFSRGFSREVGMLPVEYLRALRT
jgi:transcriptional regulator GlxA family with amidase domain